MIGDIWRSTTNFHTSEKSWSEADTTITQDHIVLFENDYLLEIERMPPKDLPTVLVFQLRTRQTFRVSVGILRNFCENIKP